MTSIPSSNDIQLAHARILPHIHNTPVLTSQFINDLSQVPIFFLNVKIFKKQAPSKCEGLQMLYFP